MRPVVGAAIAILVAVGVVAAGLWYFDSRSNPGTTSCALRSSGPIVVDQTDQPDAIDPAVADTSAGWGLVQQIYQGLVNYHQGNTTSFDGILARNWTESPDGYHWNFTLRPGAHFSNGDPFNAYVEWFSLYRALVMDQRPAYVLAQNLWFPGLSWYGAGNRSNWNASVVAGLLTDLNTFDFTSPNATEAAVMEAANQSVEVLNASAIELNLGYGYLRAPYDYLLATLATPVASAVDPEIVRADGGVAANSTNPGMAEAPVGSGPFELSGSYATGASGYTLSPDPNYWGRAAAAANPLIDLLQPANATVRVAFQGSVSQMVSDLRSGAAAEAGFAGIDPTTVADLQNVSCLSVVPLPAAYSATHGAWWLYLDQSTFPLTNLSVRAAIVHAINYSAILASSFGGLGRPWVGPVPAGYPDSNPDNLPVYAYNLPLAEAEIAASPCAGGACARTATIPFAYLAGSPWVSVADDLQTDLAAIGITLVPTALNVTQLLDDGQVDPATGVCRAQESVDGLGPFPMGLAYFVSDYLAPDDWTQNLAYSRGSSNACLSGYANASVDRLLFAAASDRSSSNVTADYATISAAMYENYTDAWLVEPTVFAVSNRQVDGIVENPMGSAEPASIGFDTQFVGPG